MAKAKAYALNIDVFKRLGADDKRYFLNLSGQARLVFEDLLKNNRARSIEVITKSIRARLQTVQEPERITGYYLIKFAKKKVNGISVIRSSMSVADMGIDIEAEFSKRYAAHLEKGETANVEKIDDDEIEGDDEIETDDEIEIEEPAE